ARLERWGVSPPYAERAAAGLVIRGSGGEVLYDQLGSRRSFARFEDAPPLVVRTLLFIENRRLDDGASARSNPAVDWGRFAKAGLLYAGHRLRLVGRIE